MLAGGSYSPLSFFVHIGFTSELIISPVTSDENTVEFILRTLFPSISSTKYTRGASSHWPSTYFFAINVSGSTESSTGIEFATKFDEFTYAKATPSFSCIQLVIFFSF